MAGVWRRALALAGVSAAALVAVAPAAAHVFPSPTFLAAGGSAKISLSFPNERKEPMTGFVIRVPEGLEIRRAYPAGGLGRLDGRVTGDLEWRVARAQRECDLRCRNPSRRAARHQAARGRVAVRGERDRPLAGRPDGDPGARKARRRTSASPRSSAGSGSSSPSAWSSSPAAAARSHYKRDSGARCYGRPS